MIPMGDLRSEVVAVIVSPGWFATLAQVSHLPVIPPVISVVGPTASGKSQLGVELALAVGGEVVNADSMQLYRGMDIGTAKLPVPMRAGVPHHLLDRLDVTEPATVADFQRWARAAVEDCQRRGVTPIVVGGSALYLRAVLDRFEFPGSDPAVRRRLEDRLAAEGTAALHSELAARDPASAEQILPTNARRIVRALEVLELTGHPFAARLPTHTGHYPDLRMVGLHVDRGELDRRIGVRAERMWAAGFVDEVRRLEAVGLRSGRTASRAVGYAQVLRQLTGECGPEEARAETVRATRRFARRQDSWFRKDPRICWLPAGSPDLVPAAVAVASRPWRAASSG
jgi:tRNA dimethylallyltransferase